MAPSGKTKTVNTPDKSLNDPAPIIYHHFDAAFRVWGTDTDIDALTVATKLNPSESHRRGDKRGNGKWEESMWSFRSTRPESSDLEDHLDHLLDILEPLKERILSAIPANSQPVFWCAHYTNASSGNAGVITLSPKLFKRLAALGFPLSVDTYSDCT